MDGAHQEPKVKKRTDEELLAAIDAGVQEGVRAALLEHKRAGRSIVIWRDGQIVEIPPEEIPVEDPSGALDKLVRDARDAYNRGECRPFP